MTTRVELLTRAQVLSTSGRGREIRESAHLTMKQLADEIPVDVKTIKRWETGQTSPKGENAIRWVQALDVIASELSGLRNGA